MVATGEISTQTAFDLNATARVGKLDSIERSAVFRLADLSCVKLFEKTFRYTHAYVEA
jgi:hypothetical protein